MASALKPYGQDRQKILIRRNAAFVFCLHQLTPEDSFEYQPLVLDNRLVMLFDGRIDNRTELSEALGIAGPELNMMPDGVIALRLFERWGERAFERILGDFAIIVMDLQDQRLICARDQMGLRVLHYHHSAKRFAVATAPEVLFALSWVPRILNKDKVGDILVNRGLNGETTYYQEINRVLPGYTVRIRGTSFSKDRFWNPENIADVKFKTDADYVEAFQERLDSAVKARMRSCRPPCSTITGGLDSSSIAVVAADMLAGSEKKLNTFTAVPEAGFFKEELGGAFFDETPYVQEIAKFNRNITPHFIQPSKGPILDQIAEQIRAGGAPSGSILNGLWVIDIVRAARSTGHNVMLTGEMGNITMSYDGLGLFPQLLRTGRWLKLFGEIGAQGHRWKRAIRWTITPFAPAPLFRKYKQWRRGGKAPWHQMSVINPDFAARSGVVDRAAREYLSFDAPAPRDCRLARVLDFHSFSETADWFGKLRAEFGVDVRTPAFDRQLVEFCIGIPVDQYFRRGRRRWLIRRAMKGRLPDTVLNTNKRGVQSADWHPRLTRERNQIAAKVKALAANADVASIIDLPRLNAILDNWPEQQPPDFSPESNIQYVVPQALGAAYFIESVTGLNYGR